MLLSFFRKKKVTKEKLVAASFSLECAVLRRRVVAAEKAKATGRRYLRFFCWSESVFTA
jgi:hypothetical protein